jgi:phosphatidate cytidylyltransferase
MGPLVSRVLVALVGVPVVLLIVWAGGWWLFALAGVAAVLALHEYSLMIRTLRPVILAAYTGALLSLLGAQLGGLDWTAAGFLSTMVLAFLLHWIATTRQSATVAIAATVLGAGWIGLCLAHLVLLREIPHDGKLATFTVLIAVWAGDIGAFFAGRLIGRHKLAPALSPGKTWEGFLSLYKEDYLSIPQSILLGAVIAVAAPLGDLFESALKRDMQVKDSGRLLAAHGGVLDRIDSLLFAAVASYYLLRAFNAA